MSDRQDLVVTWPKNRSFASYVDELALAARDGKRINFRVPSQPTRIVVARPPRCYRVHDGMVRGWTPLLSVTYRGAGEVQRVKSDPKAGFWPAGWYVVCWPSWFALTEPVAMRGFQGYRYVDREDLDG